MPETFADMLRSLTAPAAAPPVPPDPDTMDVGESRPVTLQDALTVEDIRELDNARKQTAAIAMLLLSRSADDLRPEQILAMPLENFHRAVSRMMADLMPKLEKASHLASMLNLFRQAPFQGGGH